MRKKGGWPKDFDIRDKEKWKNIKTPGTNKRHRKVLEILDKWTEKLKNEETNKKRPKYLKTARNQLAFYTYLKEEIEKALKSKPERKKKEST